MADEVRLLPTDDDGDPDDNNGSLTIPTPDIWNKIRNFGYMKILISLSEKRKQKTNKKLRLGSVSIFP